ncbi:hypothetical protein Cni_G20777 [Canna indica]|uniref:Aquaporin SIP2-1 n=1 Tax=Canna indica TaxID=4628 RepID=A0AAQ3QJS2_9LILI|nr:hypothetical protein Cni_G20777 [Canna indica]
MLRSFTNSAVFLFLAKYQMLHDKEFEITQEIDGKEESDNISTISRLRLIASDYFLSFMWVLSGSIAKYFVNMILGSGMKSVSLLIKGLIALLSLYYFAQLGKATGGSYNPLLILCYAISDNFLEFLYVVLGRIPAQVIGSIMAVWFINVAFPAAAAAAGPHLNIDVNSGALVEGLLTCFIVILSLRLNKFPSSSKKTWIKCVAKVILHFLGSHTTGGIMNPASAFGWAYAKEEHVRKEHLCVYCLAPIEATLLIAWIGSLFPDFTKHRRLHDTQYKDKIE